jgi:hypothetical protein
MGSSVGGVVIGGSVDRFGFDKIFDLGKEEIPIESFGMVKVAVVSFDRIEVR